MSLGFFLLCTLRGPLPSHNCPFIIAGYQFSMDLESQSIVDSNRWDTFVWNPKLMDACLIVHFETYFCIPHCFSISISISLYSNLKGIDNYLALTLWCGCKCCIVAAPILHGNSETMRFVKFFNWRTCLHGDAASTSLFGLTWDLHH